MEAQPLLVEATMENSWSARQEHRQRRVERSGRAAGAEVGGATVEGTAVAEDDGHCEGIRLGYFGPRFLALSSYIQKII
jgi:hypothetical protein